MGGERGRGILALCDTSKQKKVSFLARCGLEVGGHHILFSMWSNTFWCGLLLFDLRLEFSMCATRNMFRCAVGLHLWDGKCRHQNAGLFFTATLPTAHRLLHSRITVRKFGSFPLNFLSYVHCLKSLQGCFSANNFWQPPAGVALFSKH